MRSNQFMKQTPFRTFNGYLKQHAHDSLSALEQELFDLLFPLFQGTSDAEASYQETIKNPLVSALAPLIEVAPGERRPRRFSGYDLPRSRYFALCTDASGSDSQTLAHELRAYRDPIDLGMVEILDLANGCNLMIRDVTVSLAPQPAVAVLIHESRHLPARFHNLKFQQVAGLKDHAIFIYRFPYRVRHCQIERTIDLRFPEVQSWFYQTFRELPDSHHVTQLPAGGPGETPTIAHSRFNFENGQPPVPDSFWSMLPTLMNPDIGGGSPADTGSTLVSIGHWMRQNRAAALIYPSARCDVTAIFKKGQLKDWQGWILIDYRDAPVFGLASAHVITFVVSPWAWDRLPSNVRLHVAGRGSELAGSFAVENMVNYWAQDYLSQLNALEIARSIHGREQPRDQRSTPSDGLAYRAFQIGLLSLRWVRMLVQGVPAEQIENVVLELQGLALPYGMYPITGRVLELWSGIKEGATSINELLHPSLTTNDLLFRFLNHRHPGENLDKLATIGADLDLILFFLALRVRAGARARAVSLDMSGFLNETETALATPKLDEGLKTRIREYHKKAMREVKSGDVEAERCLEDGVQLQRAVYDHLRAKGDNQRSWQQK